MPDNVWEIMRVVGNKTLETTNGGDKRRKETFVENSAGRFSGLRNTRGVRFVYQGGFSDVSMSLTIKVAPSSLFSFS